MKAMQKLKAIVAVAGALALAFSAQAATIKKVKVGKVTWTLSVDKGKAIIGNGVNCAVSPKPSGALKIPAKIGNYSVWSIGANAFKECSITSVAIPKGVVRVRTSAFEACYNLKKVTFPSTLKDIGDRAFCNCISLTSAAIPSSLLSIGTEAFGNCEALTSVSIPMGVTVVGDYAFYNCHALTKAVLANGVTHIGEGAFRNCDLLKDLQLPTTTLRFIGVDAFYCCHALEHVDFAAVLEHIDATAFYETGLKSYTYRKYNHNYEIDSWLSDSLPPSKIAVLDKILVFKLTLKTNSSKYGTVSGSGWFEPLKHPPIKATAKKGYVFAGWYTDSKRTQKLVEDINGANYLATSRVYDMQGENTTLYAKFITKAADKKALKFTSATKKLEKTTTYGTAASEFAGLTIRVAAASTVTYSAKNLPRGLTIDKTTGKITGTATGPGVYKPVITVKSAAGNKITLKFTFKIAIPEFARGTYYGAAWMGRKWNSPYADVRFTIGKFGAVSAKLKLRGKTKSVVGQCSFADEESAKFGLTVKFDDEKYIFGNVLINNGYHGDVPIVTAMSAPSGSTTPTAELMARKHYTVISDGMPLSGIVGETFRVTEIDDAYSNPTWRCKFNLKLLFNEKNNLTITGTVKGKKIATMSKYLEVSGKAGTLREPVYILTTCIMDWNTLFYRELKVEVTYNPLYGTSKITKIQLDSPKKFLGYNE